MSKDNKPNVTTKPYNVICPECKNQYAYKGFMSIECPEASCKFFSGAQKTLNEKYKEYELANAPVKIISDDTNNSSDKNYYDFGSINNSSNPIYYDPTGYYGSMNTTNSSNSSQSTTDDSDTDLYTDYLINYDADPYNTDDTY